MYCHVSSCGAGRGLTSWEKYVMYAMFFKHYLLIIVTQRSITRQNQRLTADIGLEQQKESGLLGKWGLLTDGTCACFSGRVASGPMTPAAVL